MRIFVIYNRHDGSLVNFWKQEHDMPEYDQYTFKEVTENQASAILQWNREACPTFCDGCQYDPEELTR